MTYLWLRQRGVNPGAAGLGGWIPIFLNDATLAIVSLIGLLTLVLLKTVSSLLVLGSALAVLILAGSMGVLLWSLTHREKLMPLVMAIANFTAKIRRKAINCYPAEVAVRASAGSVGRTVGRWLARTSDRRSPEHRLRYAHLSLAVLVCGAWR